MKSYKTECSRELYLRVGWGVESEPPDAGTGIKLNGEWKNS